MLARYRLKPVRPNLWVVQKRVLIFFWSDVIMKFSFGNETYKDYYDPVYADSISEGRAHILELKDREAYEKDLDSYRRTRLKAMRKVYVK